MSQKQRNIDEWMENQEYLPEIIRDFHAQKALFKTLNQAIAANKNQTYAKNTQVWVDGMCYVIDGFLGFMARHGYTLQKSRARIAFQSLQETVNQSQSESKHAIAALLNAQFHESKSKGVK